MPTAGPRRDRPDLPKGYISRSARGMLAWADAERILRGGRYFWYGTTNPNGAPHLVQQWGVWVDGTLYFEGSERTRWARNLARDGRLAFGTQVGNRAVMGTAIVDVVRGIERSIAERIATQYAAKYGRTFDYRPKPEQYTSGHVFRARPMKMIVFDVEHFESAATRFTFS